MAYPTDSDLQAFALNAGVISAGTDLALDYGRVIASAIAQWEADSGWTPFIARTQTRLLDMPLPDGKVLNLRGGVLSIIAFTISGTALTQGADYFLYPLNAPNVGKPYSWVEFASAYRQYWPWQTPAQISITGSWGYAADCPEDVKHAILSLACSNLVATKSGSATGMVTSIQQDDVKLSYATNVQSASGLTPQQLQLNETYCEAVKRYRRVRLF